MTCGGPQILAKACSPITHTRGIHDGISFNLVDASYGLLCQGISLTKA